MKGLLIAAGGTGGHVFPALAVGMAWQRLYPEVPLWWVGRPGAREESWVAPLGVPYAGVYGAGWQRQRPWRNLALLYKLPLGYFQLMGVFRRWPVGVVFTTGGYPGLLPGWMASWRHIPLVLLELNSTAGRTIRWLARRSQVVFSAFRELRGVPVGTKVVWSGVPVRFTEADRARYTPEAARQVLGFAPERPLILILGGSQGSSTLNRMVAEALRWWGKEPVSILWQVGSEAPAIPMAEAHIAVRPFITDMAAAYRAATVVVSRAGGSTLGELTWWGKAAVLVPSPYVAEDHQRRNAEYYQASGAALVVEEAEGGERLAESVLRLLQEPNRRYALETAMSLLSRPDAATQIAQTLYDLAYGG